MNIIMRKAQLLALSCAVVASGAAAAFAPAAAYADTQSSTTLTLRQVDNPFSTGENQHFTINEGENLTLKGDITGGFGDVRYQWFVSTDGGKHWEKIDGATSLEYQIKNAQAGDYVYRLVASDMYSNTAYQDFFVTVIGTGNGIADAVSKAVKTGDALPIAGVVAVGALAAGGTAVAAHKRKESKNDTEGDA